MRFSYSEEQIVDLVMQAQQKSEEAREKLLKLFNPLIKKLSYEFKTKHDLAIEDSLRRADIVRTAFKAEDNSKRKNLVVSQSLSDFYYPFDDVYIEFQFFFDRLVQKYEPGRGKFLVFIKRFLKQYAVKLLVRAKIKCSQKLEIPMEPEVITKLADGKFYPFKEDKDEELSKFVRNEIEKLVTCKREVIEGYFLLGLTEEELALKLGRTQQSINRSKKRALADLKKVIPKEYDNT
jgi:DNA-directed RNA polymerase specialized sigma24 family protein